MTERKVALITGGLTGIGKGAVLELAKRGYITVIFARSDAKAPAVIEEANALGGECYYKHCDITNTEEIRESFAWIKEKFGKLDCAFNNAGFGILPKRFHELTEEEIDMELAILVKAHMMCMREELPMMIENGFGRIVNTTSGAGLVSSAHMAIYSACKHAVCGFTKSAALDYVKDNITINAIAPGTIETELITPYRESAPEIFASWAASNPIGRLGKPSEIGRVVAFLFEEESSFINGVILPVDSGCVAGNPR